MAILIRMPDFGTAVNEIRIAKWLVNEGAGVKRGDVLAEIETDKATVELESIAKGILLTQLVPEGGLAESGQPVAWIGTPGEPLETLISAPVKTRVSPIVANLAAKLSIDLHEVEASGEGGMITREDVLAAHRTSSSAKVKSTGEFQTPDQRIQAAVSRAVVQSNNGIPHLRLSVSMDMTVVEKHRDVGRRAYYDAVFLKAIACAVPALPALAQRVGAAADRIAVALAVDVGGGLFLPVIRDVTAKNVTALQNDVEAAVDRVRTGRVRPGDLEGASIALSNLGMFPVDWFEAIIFPGHVAVLALGRISERPVANEGRVEIRKMATVVLAADHRVTNGRAAATFLTVLKGAVESGEVFQ